MSNHDDKKRLRDSAEEFLALSEAVKDPQARESYLAMAESYRMLASEVSDVPWVVASSGTQKVTRRRSGQTPSLKDPLESFASDLRKKAAGLPGGHEREALLKRARLANTAAHLDDWVNSPGLKSPD